MCPEVDRVILSTDSEAIADVARQFGADVPFRRPPELAEDGTPMWPVLRHALDAIETMDQVAYDYLLLLDPTSPGRLPEDVAAALQRLEAVPAADGIVGVSQPDFNPIWHCVVDRDGWLANLVETGASFHRRQDVPAVYRINASLYIWRAEFVRREREDWRTHGRHLMHEIPEIRAIHIDDIAGLQHAEYLVNSGLVNLPWLARKVVL